MESHYQYFNENPRGQRRVGDCVIRAISNAMNKSWDESFIDIAIQAFAMADMMSSDAVWHTYLKHHGFKHHSLPSYLPDHYTVEMFCEDHPHGIYVLCLSGHVVCVKDGIFFDSWDSRDEPVVSYFKREY